MEWCDGEWEQAWYDNQKANRTCSQEAAVFEQSMYASSRVYTIARGFEALLCNILNGMHGFYGEAYNMCILLQ